MKAKSQGPYSPSLAKICRPQPRDPVRRPRLFQKLKYQATAVWLQGPPGSGKTTLVATALQEVASSDVVWIQLDEADAQPTTFFHFLGLALQFSGASLPALPGPKDSDGWAGFARKVARQLFAHKPFPTYWIFDNFQCVSGSVVEEMVAAFAEETAGDIQFFCLSHHAPPVAFAGLASKQRLLSIGHEGLSFNEEETAELVQKLNPQLSAGAPQIFKQSQGWPAAIVLMCRQRPGLNGLANLDFQNDSLLFAFIAREVYERLPRLTREVLSFCAWLPEFDICMIREFSQIESCEKVIQNLLETGLLIEQIERRPNTESPFFRLHQLFATFIRRTYAELEGEDASISRARSAALCAARNGRFDIAVEMYIEIGAFADAELEIIRCARSMLSTGRYEQLQRWIQLISRDRVAENVWLMYWKLEAQTYSLIPPTEKQIRATLRAFSADNCEIGCLLTACIALRVQSAGWEPIVNLSAWLDIALRHFHPGIDFEDADQMVDVLAGILSSHRLLGRKPSDQYRLKELILKGLGECKDFNTKTQGATAVVRQHIVDRAFKDVLPLIAEIDHESIVQQASIARQVEWKLALGDFYSNSGFTLGRADHLAKARRLCIECTELIDKYGLDYLHLKPLIVASQAARHQGNLQEARDLLQQGEMWVDTAPRSLHSVYYQCWAQLALLSNDANLACRTIRLAIQAAYDAGLWDYYKHTFCMTEATALLRCGNRDDAAERLSSAVSFIPTGAEALGQSVELFFQAHWALHDGLDSLVNRLKAYFSSIRELGHFNSMTYAAPELASLCAAALRYGIEADFVRTLIRKREFKAPGNAGPSWPWPVSIRAFGEFQVRSWGESIEVSKRSHRRPIAMLKRLASKGQAAYSGVRLELLLDELWEDEELEDPRGAFDTTLHRLRKLLRDPEAIQVNQGMVMFSRERVWLDTAQLETLRLGDQSSLEYGSRVHELLSGALLAGEPSASWLDPARAHLTKKAMERIAEAGDLLESEGKFLEAMRLYNHGLGVDLLQEMLYRGLMRCLISLGEPSEALLVYRRCREALSISLGTSPSGATELLRKQAMKAG